MARRMSRRDLQRRNQKIRGLMLIVLSMAVVIFVIALTVLTREPPRTANGCPATNRAPPAHTVILVDQTDALSARELAYVHLVILNEYNWLPLNGKLTIRSISADPSKARVPVVLCRVNDPNEVDIFTHTPAKVAQEFERMAGKPLRDFMSEMDKMPPQERSPIYEAIADVFEGTDFGPDIVNRRLVLLSDMAEHNPPLFTQYQSCGTRPPIFRTPPGLDRDFVPMVRDTKINIHYIRNDKVCFQGEGHKAFWRGLLSGMGANVSIDHQLSVGKPEGKEIWYEVPK